MQGRAVRVFLTLLPSALCWWPLLIEPNLDLPWWARRITENYVKQDGYFFMLYCRERGGYTIDAMPVRDKGDGTRHFCIDESGRLGCGMEFNGSRYACTPCSH